MNTRCAVIFVLFLSYANAAEKGYVPVGMIKIPDLKEAAEALSSVRRIFQGLDAEFHNLELALDSITVVQVPEASIKALDDNTANTSQRKSRALRYYLHQDEI